MFSITSPGFTYLYRRFPHLLALPLTVYWAAYAARHLLGAPSLGWALPLSMILINPVVFAVKVRIRDYINYRDATAAGAVMLPILPDPSPGGIATLLHEIRHARSGYMGDDLLGLLHKVGQYAFNIRVFFENRMITTEPEHIKAILATQFDDFEKGAEVRQIFEPLMGTGVFATDGELWKFHRTMIRPFFNKDRISDFDNFNRHSEECMDQMRARSREGYPFDMQELAARFTLDSSTEFLLGNDVRSLSASLSYPFYEKNVISKQTIDENVFSAIDFADAFGAAQVITLERIRLGELWPLSEFKEDRIKEPMRIVRNLVDPIVQSAIAKKKAGTLVDKETKGFQEDETFLEHLVNSTDDPNILRDAIITLLVAGRDTTASALTYTIYMLTQNPEVMHRLREEILTKVGSSKAPSYDDIREMKFLRAVINETLRLYPTVPVNLRMSSNKATTWPPLKPGDKPTYIPANTRIAYSIYVMHRREDLWGPDALVFDPDRFLDKRLQKYLLPNPFIFLPFNAGPRICLGQQFAYNEISFFIVKLLQNFSSISLAPDAQPPASRVPESWAEGGGRKTIEKIMPKAHLTMYVEGGLWLRMEEAKPI